MSPKKTAPKIDSTRALQVFNLLKRLGPGEREEFFRLCREARLMPVGG